MDIVSNVYGFYYEIYQSLVKEFRILFSKCKSKTQKDNKIKTFVMYLSDYVKNDARFSEEEKLEMRQYMFKCRNEYRQGIEQERLRIFNDLCYLVESLSMWRCGLTM